MADGESWLKSTIRPFFGLLVLQPLTLFWCFIYDLDYLSNLGIFSIICTIYLIPFYALYERFWEKPNIDLDTPKWI
jgi:hypothetical protein